MQQQAVQQEAVQEQVAQQQVALEVTAPEQVAQQDGSCSQLSLVGSKVSITLVRSAHDVTVMSLKSSDICPLAMSTQNEKHLQDWLSHPTLSRKANALTRWPLLTWQKTKKVE